jgi:hypothetical protein
MDQREKYVSLIWALHLIQQYNELPRILVRELASYII